MSFRCGLCPNNCLITEKSFGTCLVRGCKDGKLHLPYNGIISAEATDPIEKKPLYHFQPSSKVFSIGFFGCSLHCPFCQNYSISREFGGRIKVTLSPNEIIQHALKNNSRSIAYTYSEPIVHFEYVLETAAAAAGHGLKNILVTNGYINHDKGKELLENIDAVNIDLKSYNEAFYREELGGSLNPVLRFIEQSFSMGVHTEITTLLIPGKNDKMSKLKAAADFISSLSRNIPWHLSAYYPVYNYSIPATSPVFIKKTAESLSDRLNFIYTGNIANGITDTFCPECGNMLIKRTGYKTLLSGISESSCSNCGTDLSEFGIVLQDNS